MFCQHCAHNLSLILSRTLAHVVTKGQVHFLGGSGTYDGGALYYKQALAFTDVVIGMYACGCFGHG